MFDRHHFQATVAALGVELILPIVEEVFDQLTGAYGHPSRYYHSQAHIEDCFQLWQRYQTLADRPQEVALALWFHDAVYDTQRQDNEERSADWARTFLQKVAVQEVVIQRIEALIRVTKTHINPADADQALLLDIDLSILGQPPVVFQRYDRAIRQEYAWVPETEYRSARASVLHGFFARPCLYYTTPFQRLYEERARCNLSRTIATYRMKN